MLSSRARKGNAWLLEQFSRPLSRQGSKSSSNLDLATAENWLIRREILPLLKQNAQSRLTEDHLSYAGGLGGTPELLGAVSAFFNHFFSLRIPVKPEHIVTGPGCSAILDTIIHGICDEDDGILVAAPFWGSFEISAVLRNGAQLIPVHVPFYQTDSAQTIVAAYRTAAALAKTGGTRIRGLLLCNPHDPYGHICTTDVLDDLLQFCEEADIHLLFDEIYALSTFGRIEAQAGSLRRDNKPLTSPSDRFVSVLSRDLKKLGFDGSRVHVLYSISKDLVCSGLRMGCLVTQANPDLRMWQAILNNARLSTATAVMAAPLLADLARLDALVDLNVRRLRRAARAAVRFAEFHGLTYYKPVAGLYIWLRLCPEPKGCESGDEEEELVRGCAGRGVLVGSGADYAAERAGWFRLTFAVPEHVLFEALRRVEDAVGYAERFPFDRGEGSDRKKKRQRFMAGLSVLACRGLSVGGLKGPA
ncbi:PLP-dependent transferase [Parathielavia hyrcaniae]|uniref:PLP-dependent transferase n=1 Tax=Parathielavia hyrcaniae TaxID=113614 RepID=A0AAN6Q1Z6_9PEZI|nr:PLP-dependent transferase [Parathielavia hyrcaniae]